MTGIALCPLCQSSTRKCHEDKRRAYFSCPKCFAVHVPVTYHLTADAEKAEYDKHENHAEDAGYRQFLSRFSGPLCERIPSSSVGLDFGCGPGPVLSLMLEEKGHAMSLYDVFYYPNEAALQQDYDFITATEVVEHLSNPVKVLDGLWAMLRPGGVLGVMTKRVIDTQAFKTWHYKNDPTHIVFFHEHTLSFIAERWGCEMELVGSDVVFFNKPRCLP